MKCLSCGCDIDDDSVFCSKCGTKVEAPPAAVVSETGDVIETAGNAVETAAEELADKAEEKAEAADKAAAKLAEKAEKKAQKLEKKAEKKAEKLEKKAEAAEKVGDKYEDAAGAVSEVFGAGTDKALDLRKEEPVVDIVPEPEITDPYDPVVTINEALEALNGISDKTAEAAAVTETAAVTEAAAATETVISDTPVSLAKAETFEEPKNTVLPEPAPFEEPSVDPVPVIEPAAETASEKKKKEKKDKKADKPAPETAENAATGVQEQISSAAADMGQQAPPPPPPYYGQQAPPPPQYYAQPEPVPVPVRVETPVKVGALRISFAGFIAFLTVIFIILLSVMFCVKMGASGKVLQRRTEKMNISTVLDSTYKKKVKEEGATRSKKVKMNISDAIYNESGIRDVSDGNISRAEFRAYLAKTDLLKFAGKHVGEYADYILEGDMADPSITANQLGDFFADNSNVADENLSYKLETVDYNMIRTRFELKDTAENFSIEEWSRVAHFNLANSSFLFSYVTLGIILGLVIVLLVWIAVIVDGRGKHIVGLYGGIFKWSGIVVFLLGVTVVAGSSIAHVITGSLVFYLCASLLLPFGLFCICTGAVELFFGFIMKRIRRGIRNSDKRNQAVEKALTGANV